MFACERTRASRMKTKYYGRLKMKTKEKNLEDEEGTSLMKSSHQGKKMKE
jgi:hypothetical protein